MLSQKTKLLVVSVHSNPCLWSRNMNQDQDTEILYIQASEMSFLHRDELTQIFSEELKICWFSGSSDLLALLCNQVIVFMISSQVLLGSEIWISVGFYWIK